MSSNDSTASRGSAARLGRRSGAGAKSLHHHAQDQCRRFDRHRRTSFTPRPYVAKELGLFAKHCIDANILQFEGGQSATSTAAVAQGKAISATSDVAIGRGLKVKQIWGLAPRMPQAYMVAPDIKTAAELKGRKLSATGGGVGGFNWRMGREVLKSAGLKVEDAQFISSAMAGRLPGLVAGQIDGVVTASGGRVPRQEAEAVAEPAGAARRPAARLHVQRLWRVDRMARAATARCCATPSPR